MRRVPFTIEYEINQLQDQLKDVDEKINTYKNANPTGIVEFNLAVVKKERKKIQEHMQWLADLMNRDDFNPDGPCLA